MPPSIPRLDFSSLGGRQLEGIQRAITDGGDNSISNGQAVEVTLTTSPQAIAHGLNRQYLGWFFIGKQSAVDAFETGTVDETRFLSLQGTVANVAATIWVF